MIGSVEFDLMGLIFVLRWNTSVRPYCGMTQLMGLAIKSIILISMQTVSTKHNDTLQTRKYKVSSLIQIKSNGIYNDFA